MTDIPVTDDDPREAGLHAARLGVAAEQNGNLEQAIDLYRQSIHHLESIGAPEAEHVRQWLTAAELKLRLGLVFQTQSDLLKDLIDQTAGMSDEELAAYMERLAKQ